MGDSVKCNLVLSDYVDFFLSGEKHKPRWCQKVKIYFWEPLPCHLEALSQVWGRVPLIAAHLSVAQLIGGQFKKTPIHEKKLEGVVSLLDRRAVRKTALGPRWADSGPARFCD